MFFAENTLISWEMSPETNIQLITPKGLSSTSVAFKVDTSSVIKLHHTVYAMIYHLSQFKINAYGVASIMLDGKPARRLQPSFDQVMDRSVSGFQKLERLTEESIVEKAKELEDKLQSAGLIKATLAEIDKLNEEAIKRNIDIVALLPVVQKAGEMAKKDSDKEAVQSTLMQLPFENNYTQV